MDKKKRKTSKSHKNSAQNRRFNAVLYFIAGILIIVGVYIILNDTTRIFQPPYHYDGPSFPSVSVSPDINTAEPHSSSGRGTAAPVENPDETPLPSFEPTASQPPLVTHRPNSQGNFTEQPDDPVHVYFPEYEVDCAIDAVGVNSNGEMATVRHWNKAGWLYTSGTPISGGNMILAGHNKYKGNLGTFDVINKKLRPGDRIIIEMRNNGYAFYTVEKVEEWRYTEIPDYVMSLGGEARLTLITCKGDFDSSIGTSVHRVIAICRPVSVGK